MADAMVTARMPLAKKEAANKVLAELGSSPSSAVNDLYDCIIDCT